MCGIELQKHAFPRAHIVIKFKGPGPDDTIEIDTWARAQISSESVAEGKLRAQVLKVMTHKPRGAHSTNSPCMQVQRDKNTQRCDKYPFQTFRMTATVNEKPGRVKYRCADNGNCPVIHHIVDGAWKIFLLETKGSFDTTLTCL